MTEPLDYSNPDAETAEGSSGTRSLKVGIICWCAIAVCAILLGIGELLHPIAIDPIYFVLALTTIAILIVETILAFYGLLTGFIGWYWEPRPTRGIIGTILNLTALTPLVLFLILAR